MALGPRLAGGGGARRAMSAAGPAAPDSKWYFSRDQLAASPSRACGLDADKELAYRQQAANLIQDMGQRLQVSQLCINTAIVYMHRFYTFHSFTQFHRNAMAAAALFLAAKVEEQPRKLEHVIKVSHICLHRGDQTSLDVQSQNYKEQAQDLVFNENVLLQTLGFDVAIDHPHTHVVKTCGLVQAPKELAQTSYFMASNSLHLTTMCLQYRPSVVACFCVHLASKWSNWAIPQSNEGKHWFFYVDRSVTSELLDHLTAEFLHIFDRCPARLKKKIMSITNAQGTNSPQQGSSSHSNNNSVDKDTRKISVEDMEKFEYDKRQQGGLFGPTVQNSSSATSSSKMDFREYKERHQQQDRRRPPSLLANSMPRPSQEMSSSSQPRQSSSSGQRPPPNIPPTSQHRWPPNQRSKDPQSIRPHPSQSSRPHHRSSSSALPPQLSSSQPPPLTSEQRPSSDHRPPPEQRPQSDHRPPPDQRLSSRSQPPAQQQPIPHSSRIHPQAPQPVPQQPIVPMSHAQPPQPLVQPPVQPPQVHRTPSLFSPEPHKKPPPHRRQPQPPIPKELIIPAPLSPFSSSPPPLPPVTHAMPEVEYNTTIKKIEEPPSISVTIPLSSVPPNNVETDPTLVSSLLKESLSHKADKKKKKDKHKHKDREKREDRKKHKKDKDKKRESESNSHPSVSIAPTVAPLQIAHSLQATPLRITIPREALSNNAQPPPQAKLKIKIPKERLRTEPPMPAIQPISSGLKIKIPKELVEGSRKRPHDPGMMMDTLPHKAPRLPQQSHQQHKTINSMIMGNGQSGTYK